MRASLILMLTLLCLPAHAVTIERKLANTEQEQIAQRVIQQLNCVVCEGQPLADSDATFAREMRAEIRRMAAEGTSEQAILEFFRQRYGTQILLTPPVERSTLLLWLAPLLFVLCGGWFLWRFTNTRSAS
jgi:cytochrome c-type biogenesis protein CcmH